MAITLKVTGNGHFAGAETNLVGYSASEESTPISAGDSSGGTGQTSFELVEDAAADGSILLQDDSVELIDGSNGRTSGTVVSVGGSDGQLSVEAASRLNRLVADVDMPPFTGTLGAAFAFYLAQAGITTGFTTDASITARPVSLPGWSGDLWDHLKKLCAAEQVEVTLVSSNIVLRPLRGRVVSSVKNISEGWSVEKGDLAQYVEIYYYNNTFQEAGVAYPTYGESGSAITVEAGELTIIEEAIDGSVTSIQQPIPRLAVAEAYAGTESVYSIVDSEGVAIDPILWSLHGGKIDVVVGADYKTLTITVTGAALPNGPFRIATQATQEYSWPSLRIVGTGVFTRPEKLTLATGAPATRAVQVIGITVQNPFIATPQQAYTAGMLVAGQFAGSIQTITASATVVNRVSEPGFANYPTFADFTAAWTGKTYAQFTAAQGSKTFGDFTEEQYNLVKDTFENQAFGNVAGARVRFREAWYRIRSATTSPSGINYTAERDTMFSDFNSVWGGKTFAEFGNRMSGKTFADFGVIPLWQ